MATKNKKKSSGGGSGAWHGFINHNLTETDKKNVLALASSGENPLLLLDEYVEVGYAIKFSFDSYSDCPQVMIIGNEGTGENEGWAMSARHRSFDRAFWTLIYLLRTFADENGDWLKPLSKDDEYNW